MLAWGGGVDVTRPEHAVGMREEETLADRARRQHGLVTHEQARQWLTRGQLKRQLQDRRLEPVRRRVYRTAGTPESWEQLLHAACLARPGACASFRSAAALWMLTGFDQDELEITVPGTTRARLDGVIVHQSDVWAPGHRTTKRKIPVTSVARTLCDLTAVASHFVVERAVDDALRRKVVTLRQLSRAAAVVEGQGRMRCTVMRGILAERGTTYDPGGSPPEVRIARLLQSAGLPVPVPQHALRVGGRTRRVDLAYPDLGLVIEYDGWSHHSTRSAFDGDRARANELELLGLTMLRFTSASTDDDIVRTVRRAIKSIRRSRVVYATRSTDARVVGAGRVSART